LLSLRTKGKKSRKGMGEALTGAGEGKGRRSVSTPPEVPSNFSTVVAPMLQTTQRIALAIKSVKHRMVYIHVGLVTIRRIFSETDNDMMAYMKQQLQYDNEHPQA